MLFFANKGVVRWLSRSTVVVATRDQTPLGQRARKFEVFLLGDEVLRVVSSLIHCFRQKHSRGARGRVAPALPVTLKSLLGAF